MTEGGAATSSMMQVQHQIRANAANLQDYFSDLYAWEKSIEKDDTVRRKSSKSVGGSGAGTVMPPRAKQAIVVDNESRKGDAAVPATKPADGHTYDKGYKRWERFDVDAALEEADDDAPQPPRPAQKEARPSQPGVSSSKSQKAASSSTNSADTRDSSKKPRAEIERQEGNEHYKRGDYVAAIKSYTRCLGYNAQDAIVLSNRAMAFIKNREFGKAEDDCTLALKVDAKHVKSLLRRGTARNALGKHRLALLDFQRAAALDPKNRQIPSQMTSTRDLMRTAIKRAPKRTGFEIQVVNTPSSGTKSKIKVQEVPEGDEVVDKENANPHEAQRSAEPSISTDAVAETPAKAPTSSKSSSGVLPKLPMRAPSTSYEFNRVWKTLRPTGDAARKQQLLELRARYLRLVAPGQLRAIFKNSIEAEILCDAFYVFRHAMLTDSSEMQDDGGLVLRFATELARVPRFAMTVMLLSAAEKEDIKWVLGRLEGTADANEINQLKQAYELS